MEPTHADHASGRIPPRSATPPPDQAAAQAAAFRRTLDEQATSHDETTVLPPVPAGPDAPAVPTMMPALMPQDPSGADRRTVRLIDAERRARLRPGRLTDEGPAAGEGAADGPRGPAQGQGRGPVPVPAPVRSAPGYFQSGQVPPTQGPLLPQGPFQAQGPARAQQAGPGQTPGQVVPQPQAPAYPQNHAQAQPHTRDLRAGRFAADQFASEQYAAGRFAAPFPPDAFSTGPDPADQFPTERFPADPDARYEPTQALAVVPPRNPAVPPSRPARDLVRPPGRDLAATRAGSGRGLAPFETGSGAVALADGGGKPPSSRKRHSAGNRPGRLPAAIGVSAALAMIGGLVLILTNGGLAPDPTAPAALPDQTTQQIVIAGASNLGSVGGPASPLPSPSATASKAPAPPARQTTPATSAPAVVPSTSTPPPTTPTRSSSPSAAPTSGSFVALSQGSTGQEVVQLQSRLQQWGYMVKSSSRGYGSACEQQGWDTTGSDENQTTDAIYQFQRNYDDFMHGTLAANGVCNYATWQALFSSPVYVKDCYGGV